MMRSVLLVSLFCVGIPAASFAKVTRVHINSGTGFVVSKSGHIITNDHVVRGCKDIEVSGAVSRQRARVIGNSRAYDLAVLKIDGTPSDVAMLRSDNQPIEVGERAVIVGYPGKAAKTGKTVTREAKVINPKGPQGEEKWMELTDVIQQGNSGGAVMDKSGNVIGVVAAKATIYTYPKNNPRRGKTRNSGIAVSLVTLKKFLSRYQVRYREAKSYNNYSRYRVTDIAERFMVNVRCILQKDARH